MKTTLGKVKLAFLLTLFATLIVCVSIAFAGIFGAKNSAFADEVPSETTVEEEVTDEFDGDLKAPSSANADPAASDNDADGLNTSDMATITANGTTFSYDDTFSVSSFYNWSVAISYIKRNRAKTYYIKLTGSLTATDSGEFHYKNAWREIERCFGDPDHSFGYFDEYQAPSGPDGEPGGWVTTEYYGGSSFGRLTIPSGTKVILDLNGYSIDRNLTKDTYFGTTLYVNSSATLTLIDSRYYTVSSQGRITGGRRMPGFGGGVYVEGNATFNMYAGRIQYNYAEYGGGVYVRSGGTFNMYGGAIQYNQTLQDEGGGVFNNGTFNMYGGTISNNRTYGGSDWYYKHFGGGIYSTVSSTLKITPNYAAVYIQNNASHDGGGIFAAPGCNFTYTTSTYGYTISSNSTYTGVNIATSFNNYVDSIRWWVSTNGGSTYTLLPYGTTTFKADYNNQYWYIRSTRFTGSYTDGALSVSTVGYANDLNGTSTWAYASFKLNAGESRKVYSGKTDAPYGVLTVSVNSKDPVMENATYFYDGTAKTISVKSDTIPSGYNIYYVIKNSSGTIVNAAINAGTYTVTANFVPTNGGAAISAKSATLTISKRSETVYWRKATNSTGYSSTADVSNFNYTYNAAAQAPIPYFSGYINGSSKTIYLPVTGQQTNASTSNYTATATTSDYTTNYTFSGTTRTYKINNYKTSVIWTNTALEYTGLSQGPSAAYRTVTGTSNTSLTVKGTSSMTNVGTYTASVDTPANYEFSNASVTWKISPKPISVTWGSTLSFEYNGKEQAPTATYTGLSITVKGAINAGSNLTATAICTNSNYLISNPTQLFTITKKSVAINWVGENGNASDFTYTYNGTKQCPTAYFTNVLNKNVNLTVTGEQTNASSEAYIATAVTSDYTDNYSFTGDFTKDFKINPMSVSAIWENTVFAYDGLPHDPSAYYENISGVKVPLTLEPSLTGNSAVGTYEAQVKAPADTNYQVTQSSKKTSFSIIADAIIIEWTNTSFEYDGTAHGPTATYKQSDGTVVTLPATSLSGTSSATNVGSYTVSLIETSIESGEFINTTCKWSITPKPIAVTWGETTTFEYNGKEQAPTATCELEISITGAINAGEYTATAALVDTTQAKNYILTNSSKDFEITRKSATITWQGVNGSATDFAYSYTGGTVNPTAYFTDANGNKVNFTITGGQSEVSETAYTAVASTAEYLNNYDFTGAATQSFTVSAVSVSVIWENTSFEYDGKEHDPSAYYIDVTGAKKELALEPAYMGKTHVGEYTAQVKVPTDTNYQITEESKTTKYYITKATPKLTPVLGSTENLRVGMNMPSITTTEGDTPGTISWVSNQLIQGTSEYVWVFVPAKPDCYNVVTGSVELEVGAAAGVTLTEISASASATAEIYANTTIANLGDKLVITVTGKYSDGSTGTIATSEYKITAFDSTTGEVTVTMNNDSTKKATFTVYVTPKAITGITVTYSPDSNKIYKNTLLENIATIEVKVNYNDGTSKVLTNLQYVLSGTLNVGTSTVLVSYTEDGKTYRDTFDVTVSSDEVEADGISATFVQDKAFTLSTELEDIADFGTLTVEKVNNDGSREPIALTDCTLSLPEGGLKLGTNLITVTYTDSEGAEFTTTFKVFVEEDVNMTGIAASFAQNSTILTSDEFEKLSDFGTLTVEGVYSDGSKKPITENFKLEIKDNKFVEGLNTITVTYTIGEGEDAVTYTTTFTVFAQATAKKVIVIVIDNKTSILGETLAELTFTVLSGNPEFADGDIVLTKADGKAVGTYAITGEYKGEEYEVKFVEGVYTITPNPSAKQVTVVINNKTSGYGEAPVTDFDYTVIGLEEGEELTDITLERAEGTDAGKYAITGKYEGSNEFNVTFVNGVYTITPKNVTVVIDNKATKVGETIADLTYEVFGLAEGEELDGTVKLTTTAEATTPNEYAITGTFNGNNYAITWVNGKYTVKAGEAVLVILDNKSSGYGEALAELSFSMFDESADKESIANDLTITTEATEGADAGKYKITATYDGGYTVEIIEATYTITPTIVKVQIDNKLSFKGAELAPLTSNASSEFAEFITLSTTATGLTAGEYAITGSYNGSTNYDVQFVNGTYTVKEIAAGVTHVVIVIDNQTSVAGDDLNELTYTTVGLENGGTINGIELTTTADKDKVDVYKITGKYTGAGNYVVVFVEGTYTVTAKAAPEVKLTAKQTDKIFLNTTDFDGKFEFTLTVDGKETTLTADDYKLTADLEKGIVTVEFTVDGETYTETVTVFVTAKAVTGISVVYNQGTDKITPNTDPNDIQIKVTASYNDGTTAELESGYNIVGKLAEGNNCPLVVTYTDGDGITHSATFTVKVDPLEAGETTKSTIQWKNLEFVFDGKAHVPYAYYTINGGAQEVALKLILVGDNLTDGEAVNAGKYTAKIDETTEIVAGYELQGDRFHEFEIKPADIVINWTNSAASFDGDAHTPSYQVTATVNDGKVGMKFVIVPKSGSSLSADGTAVNAGNYVAKVELMDSENYTVKGDLEKEFSIAKCKVSKKPSSTIVTSNEFETLGEAIEYVKGKYGDKVTVTGEQNADGDYVITVSIADSTNYEWTEGGNEAQSFKFGSVAPIAPVVPEVEGINPILIIALIAAMVLVAFIALLVFIILRQRNAARAASGDEDGFYEAYVA